MSRTVIIDGDIIVYRTSDAATEDIEIECEEEDNNFLYRRLQYANKEQAKDIVNKMVSNIVKNTHSTDVIIALSSGSNFRKEVNPNYKLNRKKHIKPLLYSYLRNYFAEEGYKVYERPNLEADDVIGILATSDKIIKGDKCVWSFDKDFKTIPCKFAKGKPDGKLEKYIITEKQADWWFMYQTLIGDIVDGYVGCPKIGDKTARKLLGEIGEHSLAELWQIVVETYKSKGLTEDDALINARMARILRASDYDFKEKKVKLWNMENTH